MKGSMVTVLCAWSAEMSWKIWVGVSGVPFCDATRIGCKDKGCEGKTHLIVADEPHPGRLVVLIVRDHYVVCAHSE